MGRKLATTVHVNGRAYGPLDDLPQSVAAQITNPKAWADDTIAAESAASEQSGTGTGARLASTVHIDGEVYGPNDVIPDAVARKILNPKAWVGGVFPELTPASVLEEGFERDALESPDRVAAPGHALRIETDVGSGVSVGDGTNVSMPEPLGDAVQSVAMAGGEPALRAGPGADLGAGAVQEVLTSVERERMAAPPRSGRGSSLDAWQAFAVDHEVDFPDGAGRDEIIAACMRAGLISSESGDPR